MFSVIIATIWSPVISKIDLLISKISDSGLVGEIILINNAPEKYSGRYSQNSKVKEITFGENIYVNPAWNRGVDLAKFENICILNDDILFDSKIFEFIELQLQRPDCKVIGISKSCYTLEHNQELSISPVSVRNMGWGTMFFLKKYNWHVIPADFKIYFGDDWIIKQLSGFVWKLEGAKIEATFGTSHVSNPQLEKIISEDTQNSIKWALPWSNDY